MWSTDSDDNKEPYENAWLSAILFTNMVDTDFDTSEVKRKSKVIPRVGMWNKKEREHTVVFCILSFLIIPLRVSFPVFWFGTPEWKNDSFSGIRRVRMALLTNRSLFSSPALLCFENRRLGKSRDVTLSSFFRLLSHMACLMKIKQLGGLSTRSLDTGPHLLKQKARGPASVGWHHAGGNMIWGLLDISFISGTIHNHKRIVSSLER